MRNLVDAVNSPDFKPEEVKAALQAERAARAKATADLAKARDELQQVVTPKQEALLVTMGILE
jgi:Spy/CpxP family protein refolding chaperone